MQTEKKNFKIEKITINSLKIIGLTKDTKTNGYDLFDDMIPNSTPAKPAATELKEKLRPQSDNLSDDPRLSSYSRNNFNPDMLRSNASSTSNSGTKPQITSEMKKKIEENMGFMKNILKLYQAVKGPVKKQTLLLKDYKDEYYHQVVFGFEVESFENMPDDFTRIEVPAGEYFSLTLSKDEVTSSPEITKTIWKYLKDELCDQRSYNFDFQIANSLDQTITFYVSID